MLERDTTLARENFVQTIEPRVFYTYIPYRDQQLLPNFDSAEMDFSYPQLFLERRFSGEDRINDANEITLAVSSRLIHSATGNERLRFSAGQRIRFSDRRVILTSPQVTRAGSDFIAELSGGITQNIKTDTGIQLNQNNFLIEKYVLVSAIVRHPERLSMQVIVSPGMCWSRSIFPLNGHS